MQQQQKQLGSTYSTGANFSTTVVGNSATKSPNSSVDRKVINTQQIQPIDSRFCDTVKNCTFHSYVDYLSQVQKRKKWTHPLWRWVGVLNLSYSFWWFMNLLVVFFITVYLQVSLDMNFLKSDQVIL